jgi:hypothetical protein
VLQSSIRCVEQVREAGVLLSELETSLASAQKALLSGDLDRLELHTRVQIRLLESFRTCWTRPPHTVNRPDITHAPENPAVAAELSVCASRIQHLGRVQSALLARASQRLRMIANLLAGPQAAYAETALQRRYRGDGIADNFRAVQGTGRGTARGEDRSLCRA